MFYAATKRALNTYYTVSTLCPKKRRCFEFINLWLLWPECCEILHACQAYDPEYVCKISDQSYKCLHRYKNAEIGKFSGKH